MNGALFEKLSKVLVPVAGKLNNSRYLQVLRDAFMLAFPLTIFGSIAVVIANLPFLDKIMSESSLNMLKDMLGVAPNATMGVMTVFVVFGIGYYLSKSYEVEGIFGGAIALASFLLLTPFVVQIEGKEAVQGVIPLDRLGAKGMFLGMITAFIAGEIYRKVVQKNITIKMPAGVPPAVAKSFAALIPAVVTLTFFLVVNIIVTQMFQTNMHDVIYNAVQAPLVGLGSGIIPTLVAIFVAQILWFFGLHGQIIINSVMDPIWNTLSLENLNAYTQTGEVPHIVSKQFIEIYTVGMGGTGMTLAVIFAILLFMKSKQMKQVAKLGLGPGIFNVNEPIIFGLPIVMNPLVIVPWILAPMIVTLVTYLAMSSGLVPPPNGVAVPWTVPIFINGIMATNSLAGGLLQLVNFLIVLVIWFPFLKFIDRMNLQKEREEEQASAKSAS
ncbi:MULTISPECIES: PTS cellobiose transporter subunit IIC [Geobacillus]|jgi:PTS system cellobiose-specific IIC component|uniref:PTS cellobiose transporter subunit IIC n=1 Tax=Geobacillus TaxID=129337 RepID=UPI000404B6E7|nr:MULTISPECIES: PTS cellobiose transporter subunit IIC [Geobacillus]ARA96591.1 PTS system, cellobiose-specific IIC component [Geobacillus thermodenitrificans]KQB93220.1 Oligo-beta-mannoside permease IIC component [Geobacillus sp. PA-3]MEC5186810.1 PTS system cellobiose-specific IIC component [Geobacillus thermodenitrificans]MED3719064.1 PTS cellobiose transporter subunit IIC [Geobacillus thermodenitrificans]MED3905913.1 PTS cellobiose transporter subunit IIC [Geobacillus thermodenitrificans]